VTTSLMSNSRALTTKKQTFSGEMDKLGVVTIIGKLLLEWGQTSESVPKHRDTALTHIKLAWSISEDVSQAHSAAIDRTRSAQNG
jgi:hypothetical protein